MKKKLSAILILANLTFSSCTSAEINIASLSYGDENIEAKPTQGDMYITTKQLGSLLTELGIKFDDYTSGIHVLPFEKDDADVPREYELYGYWVAVVEDEVIGFQFQSSDDWGAYTVVVMRYDAVVDVASNTFDINDLKSVKIGRYHIQPNGSLVLVFEGITEDFETKFSAYNEVEIWGVTKKEEGLVFSNNEKELLLSPVEPSAEDVLLVE